MSEEQKRLMRTLLSSVQGLYNQTAQPGQPPVARAGHDDAVYGAARRR